MSDDPRWADSEARLVEGIRDEIEASPDGRITFACFMERALAEPGLGYYATSGERPTRTGDFLTAPELHPFFGRCIGGFISAAWSAAGAPARYRTHEYGGGQGTLRDHATEGLDLAPEWHILDLPDRRAGTPGVADLVLANEYLDALPVHRVMQLGGLREAYVAWVDGWFAEVFDEPSTAELASWLAADGVALGEGQRAEICLALLTWTRHVGSTLSEGGVVLVIDYGHDASELYGPRRMAGSLLTYRGHAASDEPLSAVGRSDITAHVDITALERGARAAGLELVGSTTQGRFLAALGLGERLADLGRQPGVDPTDYLAARAAVARLLDPRHLGSFRVLAFARPRSDGSVPTLPGFDAAATEVRRGAL